jgi:hypothetical protein
MMPFMLDPPPPQLGPSGGFGKAACGARGGAAGQFSKPVLCQRCGRVSFVNLQDGNVGRILPQSVGSGPTIRALW